MDLIGYAVQPLLHNTPLVLLSPPVVLAISLGPLQKVLKTIQCQELEKFYQAHFMDSSTTRELTTMVFSTMQRGRPPRKSDFYVGNVTNPSGSEQERLHLIRSIEEFRRENHNYYPIAIDWYRKPEE